MLLRTITALAFAALHAATLSAQETSYVTQLSLHAEVLGGAGSWVVLAVEELLEDLNGDGDRRDCVLHLHNLETSETVNLRLAGGIVAATMSASARGIVFGVEERAQGEDLNGDGDTRDEVFHVHDLETGQTKNLGLAAHYFLAQYGNSFLLLVSEFDQGSDLDGDGSIRNPIAGGILHVHDFDTGETENRRVALSLIDAVQSGKWIDFLVREFERSEDLNGDGDLNDYVFHVYDIDEGDTVNLGLASYEEPCVNFVFDNWLLFGVSEMGEDTDLNGDGDAQDCCVLHVHDLATSETRNLGVAGYFLRDFGNVVLEVSPFVSGGPYRPVLWEDMVAFAVAEIQQGEDLNGDGDLGLDENQDGVIQLWESDAVLHVHDLETGQTTNLGLPGSGIGRRGGAQSGNWLVYAGSREARICDTEAVYLHDLASGETTTLALTSFSAVAGRWLVYSLLESCEGTDLNGDGDNRDEVLHLYDLETTKTTNLELAGRFLSQSGEWLVLAVSETGQSEDLNGDGDTVDDVLYLHDPRTGRTLNLGLVSDFKTDIRRFAPKSFLSLSERWLVVTVFEGDQGKDLNGDGDRFDRVIHVVDLEGIEAEPHFLRGDCDADGDACSGVNDALTLLSWLFRGDTRPTCVAACDTDGNGEAELTDAVYGLDYCFTGTAPPPGPFPACGEGTEGDVALGCANPPGSCQ